MIGLSKLLSKGANMPEYEIRILTSDLHTSSVILEQSHGDDQAAIGAAAKLANGAQFEVWRDLDCVHLPLRNQVLESTKVCP